MAGLDIAKVRASFPSLRTGYIYADNAGGTQTAQQVIDNIIDYLINTNVRPFSNYSAVGAQTNQRVLDGSVAAALLFNAASVDEVGYGPSSTRVLDNIANALYDDIQSGDEFIITEEHEGIIFSRPVNPALLMTIDLQQIMVLGGDWRNAVAQL